MRKLLFAGALLAAVGGLTAAKFTSTASNAFCLQLNGGSFSGDLGFFRFTGKRPTAAGKIVQLSGRVAGLGPVYGTAVVAKDGTFTEIGATFFVDADEGQIDVSFFPPNATSGSGYGDYGAYGTSDSFTAQVVSCSLEP
jgi:hypothetical protein